MCKADQRRAWGSGSHSGDVFKVTTSVNGRASPSRGGGLDIREEKYKKGLIQKQKVNGYGFTVNCA